ncbi:hypothetical protein [Silvibacterium acidisoli]|uniref:hypothetical protein n=1 Tax=Acidobacteriaceae bacterium ZG23-2 TaxID=2883246 RepID=UPI00406CFEA5
MALTDEQVREDANELLNAGLNYAKTMLRRYGQFGPFGYIMDNDGDVRLEPVSQQDMPADPAMLLELLHRQIVERARRGSLQAASTATNVALNKPSDEGYADAVMVELEHKSGYAVKAFVPYRITGGQFWGFFPRVVRFGALKLQEGSAQLFAQ